MYTVSIIWMIFIWVMITVAKREERSVVKKSMKNLELISEKKKVNVLKIDIAIVCLT